MDFTKESLLSQEGLRTFLATNKSELKTIAHELNIGYSTLRNYTYGVTPLDSMPYRIIKALTDYASPEDLFHPRRGIYLPVSEFYALAKLAGREITPNPRAFAIEEFTKAVLLLHQREKQAKTEKTFASRYFFIDLAYQNYFLTEYHTQFTDKQSILKVTTQLQNMYHMSDEDIAQILTKQSDNIELKSTDPTIVAQLFSLSLPRTGSHDLWSLLQSSHNIHLIVTNKIITDGRISQNAFKYIDDTFATINGQTKYSFDGINWLTSNGTLITKETIAHMKETTLDELSLPSDVALEDRIYRNLINLYTTKIDNCSNIIQDMLHKHWTRHHNLDIRPGSCIKLLSWTSILSESPILIEILDQLTIEVAKSIQKQIDALKNKSF